MKTSPPDAPFIQSKRVKVYLSGDGTQMGKRLHVVNFTFSLLEGKTGSCDRQHILAMFKEPEQYDSIKKLTTPLLTLITVLETGNFWPQLQVLTVRVQIMPASGATVRLMKGMIQAKNGHSPTQAREPDPSKTPNFLSYQNP